VYEVKLTKGEHNMATAKKGGAKKGGKGGAKKGGAKKGKGGKR